MSKNRMWGGRFEGGPAKAMEAINVSLEIDQRMAMEDLTASLAHAAMLAEQKIINAEDAGKIRAGLETIRQELEAGTFPFRAAYEDIHMNIEARLAELIGPAAGRLHTARSRNDQVVNSFRMWVRAACVRAEAMIEALMKALVLRAEEHAATIMPGFTHYQSAQPVTFGHHCLAWVEMLARHKDRFESARARMNECALGAAALAGTGFPINRQMTASALGFERPMRNSLDAVSSRDFALDYLAAAAICATDLSRLGEEIVVWTTPQYGFIRLSDAFSTGSSIMPQKRNPDAAELVRAKTGRINGALIGLLTVMKGVALSYAKDFQEDKPLTFESADSLELALAAMTGMIADMSVNVDAMRKAASHGHATATDLADHVVRALGLPFREAHHVAGRAVALADTLHKNVAELSLAELQSVDPRLDAQALAVMGLEASVESRKSEGGTAPANVRREVAAWKERLK
ncbi:MAG TPA: argininosuccinate lyase [Micropepsaceae bacterium]|nr:argininosuccinate lyase [Micropepsaceae bacterium]